MTLGEQVLEFETEVSGEEFAKEEMENILKLTTLEEVKDYYMDHRGWRDDDSNVDALMGLLINLKE